MPENANQQSINLALERIKIGRLAEAQAILHGTLSQAPNDHTAMHFLGVTYHFGGNNKEALELIRRAIVINPGVAEYFNSLGVVLEQLHQIDEAAAAYRKAIELQPRYPEALDNLGNVLKEQGKIPEAVDACLSAIQLKPDFGASYGHFLYAINFHPGFTAQAIYEELKRWNALYAAPLRKFIQPHLNDRNPDRRLRIGYVSPDFRQHVVGRNLLPLLERHDRTNYEIYCYSNVINPDSMTEKFRSCVDQWRDITDQTDQSAAQMIRNDRIDILVDMSLHMAGNRLPVFAAKPAPVQATFMGYPGSTGLETIDYRLTDPYLDPPGMFDTFYSEKSIRLPETFWCYDPQTKEASVNELPALKNNYITFGCLNNFCKVNDDVIALWGKMLTAIPDSRLLLSVPAGEARQRISQTLEKMGIDPRRLEFADFVPRSKYLMLYHRMDIGLDTLPYNGHSTSLDSFWMGVPVVTLVGKTAVGRAGWSQLCNLDLKELAAQRAEEYVEIVTKLAGDLPRLAELRRTLRQRMEASPLMDANRFADNVEAAYREMWRAAVNRGEIY